MVPLVERTLWVSERSLYSMRSVILSHVERAYDKSDDTGLTSFNDSSLQVREFWMCSRPDN